MKTKILLMLVLILVMAASPSVGSAATSSAQVPFKAAVHNSTIIRVTNNCQGRGIPGLLLQVTGEGYGTHLGKTTWHTDDMWGCFDGTQGGHMKFIAANGDQLFGSFEGTWTDVPPAPVTFQGTFWITGGTGRFEGVTGTGNYNGTSARGDHMLYFDGSLTK